MNNYYFKLRRTKYDVAKYVGFSMLFSLLISSIILILSDISILSFIVFIILNIFYLLFSILFYSAKKCLIINKDEFIFLEKIKGKILKFRYQWNSIEFISYSCTNIHTRGGWSSSEQIFIQTKKRKVGIKEPICQKTIYLNDLFPFSIKEFIGKGKGYYNLELDSMLKKICDSHRIKYECLVFS